NDFAELGDPIDSISTPMRHVVCPTARHPAATSSARPAHHPAATRPARPAHHPAATRPARPAHHPAATRPYHQVPSPDAAGPARSTTVPAPCTRPPRSRRCRPWWRAPGGSGRWAPATPSRRSRRAMPSWSRSSTCPPRSTSTSRPARSGSRPGCGTANWPSRPPRPGWRCRTWAPSPTSRWAGRARPAHMAPGMPRGRWPPRCGPSNWSRPAVTWASCPANRILRATTGRCWRAGRWMLAGGYSVSLFHHWDGHIAQAGVKQSVGHEEPLPELWYGGRRAGSAVHPLPGMPADFCTDQTGEPGPSHERLPHFRMEFTPSNGEEIQSEYFVAREHVAEALAAVMPLGQRIRPLLHASEVRTVAADDLWLSPAHQRDSACIHFTWKKLPAEVEKLLPEIEERLAPFAPRPHWGKVFTLAPERVRAQYPRLGDFRTLRDRLDPQRVFRNAYVDRLLGE